MEPPALKNGDVVKIAQTKAEVGDLVAMDDLGVSPLGSGSDYTVFLQRNGVSMSLGTLFLSLMKP
jgi:N-acetylated-alpha-linked acidic dipeptidase